MYQIARIEYVLCGSVNKSEGLERFLKHLRLWINVEMKPNVQFTSN